MNPLLSQSSSLRRVAVLAALASAALSGCYIVPMQPPGTAMPPAQALAVAPVAPPARTFTARLYPANAEAASYGPVAGVVTNELNGRGHFSAVIGGEQFQGEATRAQGSQRGGVANASGTRGGILSCQYTMNNEQLDSGRCILNNGPAFAMHIGG